MNLTAILFAGWVCGAIAFVLVPQRLVRWKLIGSAVPSFLYRGSTPLLAVSSATGAAGIAAHRGRPKQCAYATAAINAESRTSVTADIQRPDIASSRPLHVNGVHCSISGCFARFIVLRRASSRERRFIDICRCGSSSKRPTGTIPAFPEVPPCDGGRARQSIESVPRCRAYPCRHMLHVSKMSATC